MRRMIQTIYKRGAHMPIVRVLEHGQVTIPKQFREVLGLKKGDLVEAELEGERVVITPKKLVKGEALKKLVAVMERVHKQNEQFSEEEVIEDAIQAVASLRKKESAKPKNT